MKNYSVDELKTLCDWVKRKEILADYKYWQELGLSDCPTGAYLSLIEKNSIIENKGE